MVIAGKYEVIGILGQGGMGVVYKVRHTDLRTYLAVKVLPPNVAEDKEFVDRFREEALKTYHLSNPHKRHPNIAQVQDVDFDASSDSYYYVMEYIQGKTVAQCLQEQGPFPLPRILTIARKVGEALAYAHNQPRPVIHRDISPSNIMIEDRSERVVVTDFGLAKELGGKDRTKDGVVIGKPQYCSPEQIKHEPLSGASDIYSLGMVMYEMYTGRQFFAGLQPEEVVNRVLDDKEENIPSFPSPPPPEFVTLVTKSIAKSRTHRYQRMEEFLHDVEVCRAALQLTPMTMLIPPPSKKEDNEARRRRLEEEQRQITLGLQGKAREARERAEQAGAAEWAATFLQQAQKREAEGEKRLEERNYPLAQDAYEAAAQFFLRAEETANETARQGTEQVRTEMETVKAEAERYRGQEKARNFYTSGLSLQREAHQLWEQKRYRQAKEVYGKARDSFADARELAHATLQGEAEAERQRAEEAKTAARTEGAAELATDLFEQAQRSEEQGAAALAGEEFLQASLWYKTALQQYEAAQQHSRFERRRRYAQTIRQQTEEAQQRAAGRGIEPESLPSYGSAAAAQQQGEAQFAAHEYEAAAQAYELARQGYERATEEAESAFQQGIATARQNLYEAQQQAAEAGAKERFAEEWRQAELAGEQGQECEERQDFVRALHCYAQAQQQFAALRQAAEEAAAREQTEMARRERARQEAAAARLRLEEERTATEHAEVADRLATELAHLQEVFAQGQAYEEQEDFVQAASLYNQARQGLVQLRRESEQKAAQERAEEARRRVAGMKQGIEPLQAWAQAKWAVAQQREADGEQAWQVQDYERAFEEYDAASRGYEEARAEAEEEQSRQQAVAASLQMAQAQREAEQRGARQYASTLYQQAMTTKQCGEQRLAERQWGQAEEEFWQARVLFVQALQKSHQEQTQQTAAAVREKALQAQQEAASWAWLCPERFAEASTCFLQANRMFARAEFYDALTGFEQSMKLFRQVRQEAALQRQKEQTEQIQARARKLQQEFLSAKSRQKKQADQALAEGDQLFQQGKYRGAWEKYQDAVSQFAALQRQERGPAPILLRNVQKTTSLASPSWRRKFAAAIAIILRQKTRLLLFAGFGLLLVVTGKYLFDHFGAPSSITRPKGKPEEKKERKMKEGASPRPLGPTTPADVVPPLPPPVQPPPGSQEQPFSLSPAEVEGGGEGKSPAVPGSPAPLQITRAIPEAASELTVTEGQGLNFAVEAEGGKGEALQYLWLLDGKEKAKGKKWTYQPDFTEGGDTPKQVTAVVTDETNQKVEKTWQVRVVNKDRPPRISLVSPRIDPIEISPGETTDFSITAADPDRGDRLLYIWTLNGREVARGDDRRQFHAPPSTSPYKVTVTVVNQDGQKDQMDWRVIIKASSSAPRLISPQPSEDKISTRVGQSLDFSVTAELPKGVQKQLRYQWNVEGGSSITTQTGNRRFVFDTPGIYRLTVFVVDSDGLQSPSKRWIIEVRK